MAHGLEMMSELMTQNTSQDSPSFDCICLRVSKANVFTGGT